MFCWNRGMMEIMQNMVAKKMITFQNNIKEA